MRRQGTDLTERRGVATRVMTERAGAIGTLLKIQRVCWRVCLCLLVAWGISGCAAYEPKPLPEASELASEPAPDITVMQVLAAEIRHPILRPVRLDPNEGLSPEAIGLLAVLLNPSLRAARDERAVADAQLLQAGLLPNPELSYDVEAPTGGATEGTVNAFGLGLSWNVASLITRPANRQGAQARQSAVEADIAWREWQTAQAAKTAVFALVGLRARIVLQEQAQQYVARHAETVREAVAHGTLMAKDLAAAEAASKQADAATVDLKRQAEQRRLELNRLLGMPPHLVVRLSDKIVLPLSFKPPAAAALLSDLEQRRLDLVALRHGYDSQEAAVRAAILEQFPRLSLGPTVGRDVEDISTVGFGVSLPLSNRSRGDIAVEQATRRKLYDEYANRLFETWSDVAMLLSQIESLNQKITAAQQTQAALVTLEESYRAVLSAGHIDILTYYGVWNDMTNSRMGLLTLREQLAQTIVALELATGLYRIPEQTGDKETQP